MVNGGEEMSGCWLRNAAAARGAVDRWGALAELEACAEEPSTGACRRFEGRVQQSDVLLLACRRAACRGAEVSAETLAQGEIERTVIAAQAGGRAFGARVCGAGL